MRTKHLLYSAAMAALFAACVNDDFETISKQQDAASDGRPTVSGVKLEFAKAEDPATRVIFDGKYHWQSNDTIGALLMDNVNTLDENKSWLEKYNLVEYIHTSYPFTYNATEDTWGCNTKMLEGNYFFAYPWENYNGQRQVKHSLLNQSQNGIGANVVAESYANNQFFIGYSRIMAGAEAKDVLNTVEMVSTLGAIQLRITNTGTQTRHINKVVLSGHNDVASVLTFDPTDAQYGTTADPDKWNLQGVNWFNYANYEGEESENELYRFGVANSATDYVYNIESGDEYQKNEALRAVVKTYPTAEKSAQLVINGSADERALRPNAANTAYVLIMCNPLEIDKATTGVDQLLLSIYTDEGFVQNIDLSDIHAKSEDYTVVTNSKIEKVGPSVSNTIEIQIDDNSFIVPEKMDIFNSADLLQFIKWNTTVAGTRVATADLKQDVTFTAEMLDALKANKNTSIIINGDQKLTLAEDVPATVLDEAQLTVSNSTTVVVTKALTLTKESDKVASIEVAEGATLSINEEKAVVPNIDNYGTLTLGANSAVSNVTIKNYGTMEVAKGGDCKAAVVNYKEAVINNNGYMQNVTNQPEGIINLGENSTLANVKNSGLVKTAKGAVVTGENDAEGEVQYVDGANLSGLTNNGDTSYEVTATVIDKNSKFTNVNKLIIKKAVTVTDATGLANIVEIELGNDGALTINKDVAVTVDGLLVSGNGSVSGEGTLNVTNVKVEEGAELTNSGNIVVTNGTFDNEGTVYNNGSIKTPGANVNNNGGKGTWKYNPAGDSSVKEDPKVEAMNAAVEAWAEMWNTYMEDQGRFAEYYDGAPYDYKKFVATVLVDDAKWNPIEQALRNAGFGDANFKTDDTVVEPAEFKAAVNKVVTATNWATLSKTIINEKTGAFQSFTMPSADATLYDNEAAAYDAFAKYVASANITGVTEAVVKASIWTVADADIKEALAATNVDGSLYYLNGAYAYIWKGCKLDVVMTAYNQRDIAGWNSALDLQGPSELKAVADRATLVAWMNAIYNASSTGNSFVDNAKEAIKDYIAEFEDWGYVASQIKGLNTKDK